MRVSSDWNLTALSIALPLSPPQAGVIAASGGTRSQGWHRDTVHLDSAPAEVFYLRRPARSHLHPLHLPILPHTIAAAPRPHNNSNSGALAWNGTRHTDTSPHCQVHLNPHSIVLFVPFCDLTRTNGPTEFMMDTHLAKNALGAGYEPTHASAQCPAGSVLMSD